MNLFDLFATLSLDTSKYESALGDAETKAKGFGDKLAGAFKGAVGVVAGLGTAVVGLSTAFVNGASKTAQYGDNIDKMSQKIGISSEAYQKWDYVMQRAGGSVDSLKMGMKTLSQQAEKNSEDFQKLGISQEEVASLSQEELFEKTIKGLSEMEAGTERATLASKLLGRAGVDLGPLLNQGSDAIEEQMEMAEKYGMVMPESAVKASASFQDSITTMTMTMTGLKNRLMGDFLPAMTKVTDGLAKIFTGDLSGADDIVAGIEGIVTGITEKLPEIRELGGKIVSGLASALLEGAPLLFKEGTNLILDLSTEIVNSLPEIVDTGTEILVSIIDGIVDAIPKLINALPKVIVSLITTLSNNLPKIIQSGSKILVSIVQGIISAIPQLVRSIPTIISTVVSGLLNGLGAILESGSQIVSTLIEGISGMWGTLKTNVISFASNIPQYIRDALTGLWSIGSDIVSGLWSGISDNLRWIKDMISGWVGNVKDFLKSLFGISSPSKWARDVIGGNIVKGLSVGLENGEKLIQDSFDSLLPDYNGDYALNVSGTNGIGANGVSIVNYITVDGAENPEEFTDRFVRRLRMDMRTI